jgi:hypothetical protein
MKPGYPRLGFDDFSTSCVRELPRMLRSVQRNRLQRHFRLNFSGGLNGPSPRRFAADQEYEPPKRRLGHEAKALTLSLYRTVLRSARVLGQCNENDEVDFKEREEKSKRTLEDRSSDVRLNMMSMLPAVDRVDELRSRMLYYKQYARENFTQESDCLDNDNEKDWAVDNISRFTYLLKRGEEHRKWLLKDMKFPDPYSASFDLKRVEQFDQDAKAFAGVGITTTNHHLRAFDYDAADAAPSEKDGSAVNDDDIWNTDDEEDETTPTPSWLNNRKNR